MQALVENLENGQFVMPTPIKGSLYVIWQYFNLSYWQINSIMQGQLLSAYNLTTLIFFIEYDCPAYTTPGLCDPVYLAGIQWAQSYVTLNPPGGLGEPVISIALSNSSTPGYPELYYYHNNTSNFNKYKNYNFTVQHYRTLFNYNRTNGFPLYDTSTLLDVGQLNLFFSLGYQNKFDEIANTFKLNSVNESRILWDYVNGLIDFTALQGCYDNNVYNIDNRGLTTEASLGTIGSQTLYGLLLGMAEVIPIFVTSVYDYYSFLNDKLYCEALVQGILPDNTGSICSIQTITWSLDSNGIAF